MLAIGDIVSYDGEYRVVVEIPQFDSLGIHQSGEYVVRWDNPKENDFECWIEIGDLGVEIGYDLEYINIDGSLKSGNQS
jgi:hypothetical protein